MKSKGSSKAISKCKIQGKKLYMKRKKNYKRSGENMNENSKEYIKQTAKETAEEVIATLKNKNMIDDKNYYKKVEKILYNYSNIKESIEEKEEEIKELEKYGLKEKSKSITVYGSGGGNSSIEDRYLEKLEKYRYEKQEIVRYINRIERALKKIKSNKYYKIIELKYIVKLKEDETRVTDDSLAEMFEVDKRTIIRNKKRLVNKLAINLFPESIIE